MGSSVVMSPTRCLGLHDDTVVPSYCKERHCRYPLATARPLMGIRRALAGLALDGSQGSHCRRLLIT